MCLPVGANHPVRRSLAGVPARRGYLVGVAEIAELLDVSRQRADVLTRSKGWPDAVSSVLPVDEITLGDLHTLAHGRKAIPLDEIKAAMIDGADTLPEYPRLWRLAEVKQWAAEDGRDLAGE